ncbi:short-chain dehydrogenase/reductase SDR [Coprinopsis marcescibilis]|uniref:Short-chain dehydrogenase/reductase SDR n=1 Tax=Coprinopsis marcescibilis TaxID=230819 RepID=A0A5C3KIK0_COPMA|nr:short-chain dehydrogenase/reductase SDR [Coprinopsis marcescibilis]
MAATLKRLNAKTAIVTGASSGIGQRSAVALSKAGWNVVISARRAEALEETAKECPSSTLVVPGDVTDEGFVKKLFALTLEKYGKLDLLFNNAGIPGPKGVFDTIPLVEFKQTLDVNVTASFLCAREAFRIFKKQDPQGGRIINNGSIAAHVPRPHTAAYAISKHAISGLTKATALDGRPFGIACTQIDIGNACTSFGGAASSAQGALQPDGRYVPEATFDPEHVASTIVHIASLPNEVSMLEVNIMATAAPYVGRG